MILSTHSSGPVNVVRGLYSNNCLPYHTNNAYTSCFKTFRSICSKCSNVVTSFLLICFTMLYLLSYILLLLLITLNKLLQLLHYIYIVNTDQNSVVSGVVTSVNLLTTVTTRLGVIAL